MAKDAILRKFGLPMGVALAALSLSVPAEAVEKDNKHSQTKGLTGIASVYSVRYAGGKTASGEINRLGAMTAAHRTLPFGTKVVVTNKRNGRTVLVRVNDRGPFIKGRVIDLSPAAARSIGVSGLAPVVLAVQ
jgi:rare lipoprotein A